MLALYFLNLSLKYLFKFIIDKLKQSRNYSLSIYNSQLIIEVLLITDLLF